MVFNNSTIVDLWVLPTPAQSQWFARVDWYLNWQLCRGLAYEKAKPSVELFRLMEVSGFQFAPTPEITGAGGPLLVSSQGRLPAEKCVVVEKAKTLRDWLRRSLTVAGDLQAGQVRVFLPAGASVSEAREIVKGLKKSEQVKIEFSADEDATQ